MKMIKNAAVSAALIALFFITSGFAAKNPVRQMPGSGRFAETVTAQMLMRNSVMDARIGIGNETGKTVIAITYPDSQEILQIGDHLPENGKVSAEGTALRTEESTGVKVTYADGTESVLHRFPSNAVSQITVCWNEEEGLTYVKYVTREGEEYSTGEYEIEQKREEERIAAEKAAAEKAEAERIAAEQAAAEEAARLAEEQAAQQYYYNSYSSYTGYDSYNYTDYNSYSDYTAPAEEDSDGGCLSGAVFN